MDGTPEKRYPRPQSVRAASSRRTGSVDIIEKRENDYYNSMGSLFQCYIAVYIASLDFRLLEETQS